ncbi:hypothetical protein C447_01285 [Halococcus hamelinensis 100A6]|uniref:Uncharacterized protein n=1 Tax=Halococcus hamelinensis 100A6 TaxID=1132509 RepID=M0MAN1_9EURY|nr:hypothetical protein C447_01285 [Halococcus hamelinensis 100A6]
MFKFVFITFNPMPKNLKLFCSMIRKPPVIATRINICVHIYLHYTIILAESSHVVFDWVTHV